MRRELRGDEATLPALLPFVGQDRVVWGSDYPHHDATFPGAVEALRRTLAPLPVDAQARTLGANAQGLYRLPSRRQGAAGVVDAYFAAVTRRDGPALARVSSPMPRSRRGDGATGEPRPSYEEGTFRVDDLLPCPGPPEVRAGEVVVDIDLHVAGTDQSVTDTFTIAGDRIEKLRIDGLGDRLGSRLAGGPG